MPCTPCFAAPLIVIILSLFLSLSLSLPISFSLSLTVWHNGPEQWSSWELATSALSTTTVRINETKRGTKSTWFFVSFSRAIFFKISRRSLPFCSLILIIFFNVCCNSYFSLVGFLWRKKFRLYRTTYHVQNSFFHSGELRIVMVWITMKFIFINQYLRKE